MIGAALVVAMLFEGWPSARLPAAASRIVTLTAAAALALDRALAAYADGAHWVRAAPEDWVTTASLSFAGAGIILHVAVGRRWPFAATGEGQSRGGIRHLSGARDGFFSEEGSVTRHSRQEVAELLKKAGLHAAAEKAIAELPDQVDAKEIEEWGMEQGITRDALISQLGGSP